MHLIRLTVCNFRGFFGRQSLDFAAPGSNAVTVIHGENGAGKTNLLNALFWCFTGSFTPRLSNPEMLINKVALHAFGDRECYVEVVFSHDGYFYEANRFVIGQNDHRFVVTRVDDGQRHPVPNERQFIERIIPKALSRWFFFDAEAIGELELSGSDVFRQSLRRILGFELVDVLLGDLQEALSKKQRSLTNLVNVKELNDIQKKIDDINAILPTQKRKQKEQETEVQSTERKIKNIDEQLRELPKSKPLQERRSRLEFNRGKRVDAKKELQEQSMKYLGEVSPAILISNKALSFSGQLHLKENTGRLPAPFSEQLVEDILHDGKCVCGRPVEPHSSAEENIKNLLKHASTTAFNSRIRSIQYLLKEIGLSIEGYKTRTDRLETDINNVDSEIAQIDHDLKEIRGELQLIDEDSIRALENERHTLRVRYRDEVRRLGVIENNINENERRLKELSVRYDNAAKRLSHGSNVKSEINKIQRLHDYLKRTIKAQEHRALNVLMVNLNSVLDKFLTKHYLAKISPSTYAVDLLDEHGRHVGRSTGEGQVLKFAFITTVVALAGRKTVDKIDFLAEPTVAPLVLDAPFSALDPEYQSSVAENLAKQTSQLVLLLSSAGWGDAVANALNPHIGKRYVIISRQAGPRGSKPIKTQAINGQVINLNEFDCERDESVIKELN
jgi:DNA sulfur modification protein DndD